MLSCRENQYLLIREGTVYKSVEDVFSLLYLYVSLCSFVYRDYRLLVNFWTRPSSATKVVVREHEEENSSRYCLIRNVLSTGYDNWYS